MAKNREERRVTRIYAPWKEEEEAEWLESMAAAGWLLTGYGWFTYRFRKAEPQKLVFRSDFPQSRRGFDREEYLRLFRDSGWELAAEWSGWYYFFHGWGEGEVPEIFTDSESRIEKYSKLRSILLIVLVLCGLMPLILAVQRLGGSFSPGRRSYGDLLMAINFVSLLCTLIATGLLSYISLRLTMYIRKLRAETLRTP